VKPRSKLARKKKKSGKSFGELLFMVAFNKLWEINKTA